MGISPTVLYTYNFIFQQTGDQNHLFDAIAANSKALEELNEKKSTSFKIPSGDGKYINDDDIIP